MVNTASTRSKSVRSRARQPIASRTRSATIAIPLVSGRIKGTYSLRLVKPRIVGTGCLKTQLHKTTRTTGDSSPSLASLVSSGVSLRQVRPISSTQKPAATLALFDQVSDVLPEHLPVRPKSVASTKTFMKSGMWASTTASTSTTRCTATIPKSEPLTPQSKSTRPTRSSVRHGLHPPPRAPSPAESSSSSNSNGFEPPPRDLTLSPLSDNLVDPHQFPPFPIHWGRALVEDEMDFMLPWDIIRDREQGVLDGKKRPSKYTKIRKSESFPTINQHPANSYYVQIFTSNASRIQSKGQLYANVRLLVCVDNGALIGEQ